MAVGIIKLVDKILGVPLCLVLGVSALFKGRRGAFRKVLFIQLWGIGETVLALPALAAFKRKHGLEVLCTNRNRAVLEAGGHKTVVIGLGVFSVLGFILKNFRKYDLVVDMEEYLNVSSIMAFFAGKYRIGFGHGIRSLLYNEVVDYDDHKHVAEVFMDLVRVLGIDGSPRLIKLKSDKGNVRVFLKNSGITKKDFLVGITPGAAESARSRMWPKERFAELADALIEKKKAKVVFIGADYEAELIHEIMDLMRNKALSAAGRFSLTESFGLIEECKLYVSNDTGPMHIAAAQGVKTIGLFGPNLPERFGPYGEGNVGLYKGQVCQYSPCINVHKGQTPGCRFAENKCMKAISVADVLKFC